jgi:hypothetical protein
VPSELRISWIGPARCAAAALVLIVPTLCRPQALTPADAMDRFLAAQRDGQPLCSDLVFSVQIDASLPALRRHGSMIGFKRIVRAGQTVYRGLRFSGDNAIKTQVISRFLAQETNPPAEAGESSLTPQNYTTTFARVAEYNGLMAYVFVLKPHHKRAGLFKGELWLDAYTASPLRLWGDLVKSPSIFVRSLRFVQDYQTVSGCATPLRLLLTSRTRIAGLVEMTVWLRPFSEPAKAAAVEGALPDSEYRGEAEP